jgi:hypothetical protein
MKPITLLMLAFVFVSTAFAKPGEAAALAGNFSGEISAKSFFESNGSAKVKSDNRYDVNITFSDDVFILQSTTVKCMGKFTVDGEFLQLELDNSKGNAELAEKICAQQYKFSTSGDRLMLISDQNKSSDLIIFNLTKKLG